MPFAAHQLTLSRLMTSLPVVEHLQQSRVKNVSPWNVAHSLQRFQSYDFVPAYVYTRNANI
jgi:hypothetical protein